MNWRFCAEKVILRDVGGEMRKEMGHERAKVAHERANLLDLRKSGSGLARNRNSP